MLIYDFTYLAAYLLVLSKIASYLGSLLVGRLLCLLVDVHSFRNFCLSVP
jgi:hypothetical protein